MRITVPLLIGLATACTKTPPAESPQTQSSSPTSETTVTQAGLNTSDPDSSALQTRTDSEPQPATRALARDNTPATTATEPNANANASASRATPEPTPAAPPSPRDADNTRVNERDRDSSALTPMDQGNGGDLKISQEIRKAVVGNKSLSFKAKNVKIITVGGKVTLRGPVKSAEERATIEAAARNVAGVTQIDNQLEVSN